MSEVVPDPMEGEQTWPLEEELKEGMDQLMLVSIASRCMITVRSRGSLGDFLSAHVSRNLPFLGFWFLIFFSLGLPFF